MSITVARPLHTVPEAVPAHRIAGFAWMAPIRRWHLLSLDAPAVAAVWLLAFDAGVPWHARLLQAAALAVAVWLLYVGDRLLDATGADGGPLQARHLFHHRHRRAFIGGSLAALPLLLLLVAHLQPDLRTAWLWLAAPMAFYATAIHRWPIRRMPKELVVALMFASATSLPTLLNAPAHRGATLLLGLVFASTCWLNCVGIARWEGIASHHNFVSRSTAWGARHLRGTCVSIALLGLLVAWRCGPAALACSGSAMLLLLLDGMHRRLDAVTVRALADAALLTPLLLLPFLR